VKRGKREVKGLKMGKGKGEGETYTSHEPHQIRINIEHVFAQSVDGLYKLEFS